MTKPDNDRPSAGGKAPEFCGECGAEVITAWGPAEPGGTSYAWSCCSSDRSHDYEYEREASQ